MKNFLIVTCWGFLGLFIGPEQARAGIEFTNGVFNADHT
jgi:hypothetical protein